MTPGKGIIISYSCVILRLSTGSSNSISKREAGRIHNPTFSRKWPCRGAPIQNFSPRLSSRPRPSRKKQGNLLSSKPAHADQKRGGRHDPPPDLARRPRSPDRSSNLSRALLVRRLCLRRPGRLGCDLAKLIKAGALSVLFPLVSFWRELNSIGSSLSRSVQSLFRRPGSPRNSRTSTKAT